MDVILQALAYLADPLYWGVFAAGTLISAAIGLIPGVGSLLVMALVLPFLIFTIDDPAIAMVMLAAITGCSNTLDSLPAVLLGMPSGGVQVTFLEGHQLARRGQGAYAMGAVYAVSALGGIVGAIALGVTIPIIRPFILAFNYGEIAVLAAFGMAMVAALSRGAILKGFIGTMFGVLLGTVGIDVLTGQERFTFGLFYLWEGLPTIATLLGIFAIPELIDLSMTRSSVAPPDAEVSVREVFRGARAGIRTWKTVIRQALFGVFMGAIPGVGSSVVEWLAYAFGIVFSKDKSQFGKGSLEGLLFAESAQNAKEGGQAIPTLALGIPGGTGWILVIVALIAFGITPGLDMVTEYAHITMLIVITLALGNLVLTTIAMFATGYLAKLTQVPYPVIGFTIIPISLLSAFLDLTTWYAILIVYVFTVIGLLMKRFQWPRPPLVLGFILGPIMDENFQSAVSIMGIWGVVTRPLTIVLAVLVVAMAVTMYIFIGRSEEKVTESMEEANVPSAPAGAAPTADQRQWRITFHAEQLFTLGAIVVATAAMVAAWDYPPRARALPLAVCIGILLLSVILLVRQLLTREVVERQIFDLGLRSRNVGRTGLIVAGLFGLFVLVGMAFGMRIGALTMAFLGPLLLMERRALLSAVIATALVWLFSFTVMDRLVRVFWPEPWIGWLS